MVKTCVKLNITKFEANQSVCIKKWFNYRSERARNGIQKILLQNKVLFCVDGLALRKR